jgi:hypothetical protein
MPSVVIELVCKVDVFRNLAFKLVVEIDVAFKLTLEIDVAFKLMVEIDIAFNVLPVIELTAIVDAPIFMARVLTLEIDAALSRFVKPVLKNAVVVETLDVKTDPHG